ncbi:MAG: class I SAM-dependent RNA methyltransferase [Verrucomicrobia bacterium]|jgi:23S rRNA (uracil1939-C5)-methyltransferase/tRNA (uracil-5-)-methyltransferase|nr:class I SAM-dependent RNA methyltransferase [Verrucomicrobiota bacterium]NBS04733.1 class I SAM-dependent RNA methyltransferase [Verrucomicrobiota bacterium]NBY36965.1 class I SAM-dependent RNA methyltransferase [Verrucomicrobiota bacterium]
MSDFEPPQSRKPDASKFRPGKFTYHQEIEVEIATITNLGEGLARVDGWVVFIPGALPGEKIVARVWHNSANFSRADLVRVVVPSPHRVQPRCDLFGECGGCQYQNLAYPQQLEWKRKQVAEAFERLGGLKVEVDACHPSPKQYGYRSKITPHFMTPRRADFPIGFLASGTSRRVIDVPKCPIATDAINSSFAKSRKEIRGNPGRFERGATLLFRDCEEGVITDPRQVVTEKVGAIQLKFLAGEFFQNNPSVLEQFVGYAIKLAQESGAKHLVDTYCGSGLFALSGARQFESVNGVEVSAEAARKAAENATLNRLVNCRFIAGTAESIFKNIPVNGADSAVIVDPPRKGCDEAFLEQLHRFNPRRIVYVSCAPDTQARDLKYLCTLGWKVIAVRPFDLFPQTRHVECIAALERA